MGCSGEVEGHPPGLEAHEENPDIGVMGELLNHAVPVVHSHTALQPYTLHSSLHNSILAGGGLLLTGRGHSGGVGGGGSLFTNEVHSRDEGREGGQGQGQGWGVLCLQVASTGGGRGGWQVGSTRGGRNKVDAKGKGPKGLAGGWGGGGGVDWG